jgi:replication initiation and membrane attachment protein DnaB
MPLAGAQTVGVYATLWLRLPQTPFSAVSAVLGCMTMEKDVKLMLSKKSA